MKIHKLTLLAAALMLLVQLVGCGSGGSSSSNTTSNTSTASATPTPSNLIIVPPVASAATGASLAFTTLNASGTAVYSMRTNASGGSMSASGLYIAGTNPHVTDIIQVTDGSGAVQAASILVSPLVTVAPASAAVGISGPVTLSATGGSGSGYAFSLFRNASGATISGSNYTGGASQNSFDIVACTDSASNLNFSIITVGSLLGISSGSGTFNVAPRGTLALQGAGGTGQFTWFFASNLSGGTLNQGTGAYTAGPNGGVSDVVTLLDSVQHYQVTVITVGATLTITPANPVTKAGSTLNFLTAGGSGTGLTWTLSTNQSGGTIVPASGVYTAGPIGNATDTVSVTDSLGNTTTTNVTVTP